ncbi:hypothetical protein RKE29_12335 [Streptomyces sp. B1866]|uniref:hypothetical protein n=1 Tax=Streptomyces sp. B1866 TaxID=3075431 RepID=UPI00288EF9B4|nr:hypothetical protein [Streptomyces sp. B1866]MDT3397427.1 hypothetical protein [Streptomyces sp. B1866]
MADRNVPRPRRVITESDNAMALDINRDHRGPGPFILRHHGPNSGCWSITSRS